MRIGPTDPSYLIKAVLNPELVEEYPWLKKDEFYKTLNSVVNNKTKYDDLLEAVKIYLDPNKRLIINAFIFAKASNEEIASYLKLKETVIVAYRVYLFKEEVFTSDLDKFAFINSCTSDEIDAYRYALKFGKDFVKWKICGLPIEIQDVRSELSELFTLAKFKTGEAAMNSITKESSKEAGKWMSHAIKLAEILSKQEGERALSKDEAMTELSSNYGSQIIGVLVGLNNENTVKSTKNIPDEEELV